MATGAGRVEEGGAGYVTRLINNLTRELYEEVKNGLPEGKPPGPDGVRKHIYILKRMPPGFHDLLFEVIRRTWIERSTHMQSKRSVVALLHKKGGIR